MGWNPLDPKLTHAEAVTSAQTASRSAIKRVQIIDLAGDEFVIPLLQGHFLEVEGGRPLGQELRATLVGLELRVRLFRSQSEPPFLEVYCLVSLILRHVFPAVLDSESDDSRQVYWAAGISLQRAFKAPKAPCEGHRWSCPAPIPTSDPSAREPGSPKLWTSTEPCGPSYPGMRHGIEHI
eukprot:13919472-Alexandrium_andersonii.AAC.1